MKLILIFFITIWTNIIVGAAGPEKKFIVLNEDFYKKQEEKVVKENKPNPYFFPSQLENIYFDFSFISSANDIQNYITVSAIEITTLSDYKTNYSKLEWLTSNTVKINDNNSLSVFFKEKFSDITVQLLKGCLSYAYANNKAIVTDQNLVSYLHKSISEAQDVQNPVINNFEHVANQHTDDIIFPIHIILNPKEKKSLLDTWALISSYDPDQKTVPVSFMDQDGNITQNLDKIVTDFNNEYKKFVPIFKDALAEYHQHKAPPQDDPNRLAASLVDYTIRYGLPAAHLYSTYSTLKSGYQSVGSLSSFLKIPRTTTGKAKAVWNIYSIYSSFKLLYGYTKLGLNWLKGKIYGNKK
jgi:hypothetical protein